MKSIFFNLFFFLAAAAILSSCGTPQGKRLDEISDASSGDTLLYYFGQIQASQYWKQAESDSSLYSKEARDNYLSGLRTALKLIGDDESYNAGIVAGVRMASNIRQFSSDYGIKLNPEVLLQSIAYGLEEDPLPGDDTNNEDFYRLLGQLQQSRNKADKENAKTALKEAAAQMKMTQLDSNLYYSVETKGIGAPLENDLTVEAEIHFSHDGRQVIVPLPSRIKVGATSNPPVLNKALLSMTEKETANFITTAHAIFGNRCGQHHLKPKDIVRFNIKLGRILSTMRSAQSQEEPTNVDSPVAL